MSLTIMHLPWDETGRAVKTYALPEPLHLEQWLVPAGTVVKMQHGRNHGVVSVPQGTRCEYHNCIIPKRLFRY